MHIKSIIVAALLAVTSTAAQAQQTTYPLSITNGDHTLVFDHAPERAVSLNAHTTEIMLTLGLAPKMVGTAYQGNPIMESLKADFDTIPVLSDGSNYPSLEVLVGSEADFVYGRLSAFRDTSVATVETLRDYGINAYVVKGTLIKGATMEDVYEDISNLGLIFDIQGQANALNEKIRTDIADIHAKVSTVSAPIKVLVYDSGEDAIFTAGNSLQTELIKLAGGKNVFDDLEDTWATVSWEEAVARNPDVIVINDYGQTPLETKIARLKENPALASMPAIKDDHFVVLPLDSAFVGVRNPEAVRILAEGFYPELFK